jgi:hypothetical protein
MAKQKITTIEEAKALIKEKCKDYGIELEESIIKGHKWFWEDAETDEPNQNQSQGNHFDTDEEVIELCNDIFFDED